MKNFYKTVDGQKITGKLKCSKILMRFEIN
jgi:hypothetical protein